jgi:FkbM family methyltransferase
MLSGRADRRRASHASGPIMSLRTRLRHALARFVVGNRWAMKMARGVVFERAFFDRLPASELFIDKILSDPALIERVLLKEDVVQALLTQPTPRSRLLFHEQHFRNILRFERLLDRVLSAPEARERLLSDARPGRELAGDARLIDWLAAHPSVLSRLLADPRVARVLADRPELVRRLAATEASGDDVASTPVRTPVARRADGDVTMLAERDALTRAWRLCLAPDAPLEAMLDNVGEVVEEPSAMAEALWRELTTGGHLDWRGGRLSLAPGEADYLFARAVLVDGVAWAAPRRTRPTVVAAGSGSGLVVAPWMAAFPEARLTALEPSPEARRCLAANARALGWACIPRPLGLAADSGPRAFEPDPVRPGRLRPVRFDAVTDNVLRIECARLSSLISEPVDLLWLDVGGDEEALLAEASGRLANVDTILVLLHDGGGSSRRLDDRQAGRAAADGLEGSALTTHSSLGARLGRVLVELDLAGFATAITPIPTRGDAPGRLGRVLVRAQRLDSSGEANAPSNG